MVEVLKCPRCGKAALEILESGELFCMSCSARYVLTPSRTDLVACLQCGFLNQPQANSCAECGVELVKYCPQCGARLDLRMRFCDQCGASHEESSMPDGLCQWCHFENAKEASLCVKCGARLITTCPTCEAEMKAGVNFCRACGLDYGTLLESKEA